MKTDLTTKNNNILADEETKPTYQSPAVVVLGELAKGYGAQPCNTGLVGATPGSCNNGVTPTGTCSSGGSP